MNHPTGDRDGQRNGQQKGGGGFRLAELVICLAAVLLGIVYLNTTWLPLGVLLPIYAVFFTALPVLRLLEARKNGSTGVLALLPAVCYLLLSFVVIGATVLYFVKY